MVAEEKMANVFICMLQFGKLLKLYFFLFQSGPRLELTVQSLPKLLKGEAGSRGKGLSPSVISSTIPTSPCTALLILHSRVPHPCLLAGEVGEKRPGCAKASLPDVCFLAELLDSLSDRIAAFVLVREESCHGAVTARVLLDSVIMGGLGLESLQPE